VRGGSDADGSISGEAKGPARGRTVEQKQGRGEQNRRQSNSKRNSEKNSSYKLGVYR
jgi:hypothetical protein